MKSESQHKKHPGGRKPKFDYRGEEFLSQVETYAKKGFTDREIAFALGLNPTYFYEMKSKYSEITDVLARGRATITAAVRAKFLAVALGGIKTKSTVVRKLKDQDGNLTGPKRHSPMNLARLGCSLGCSTPFPASHPRQSHRHGFCNHSQETSEAHPSRSNADDLTRQ
jgi:hypothetical protein